MPGSAWILKYLVTFLFMHSVRNLANFNVHLVLSESFLSFFLSVRKSAPPPLPLQRKTTSISRKKHKRRKRKEKEEGGGSLHSGVGILAVRVSGRFPVK